MNKHNVLTCPQHSSSFCGKRLLGSSVVVRALRVLTEVTQYLGLEGSQNTLMPPAGIGKQLRALRALPWTSACGKGVGGWVSLEGLVRPETNRDG